ncbi:shikimate kinase [Timonella sp. A28]|uniref:shikimate kinase n=1 Tax=Timonella sp. A28 TaxID=3442640 RepID=UPI003EB923CB
MSEGGMPPSVEPGPWLILIGPAGAGKSTLGRALADMTGRDFIDIDEAGQPFYEEVGWPVARIYDESAQLGWVRTERAWEVARAHAVEQVVKRAAGSVLALGAGHTNYSNRALFSRVKNAVSCAEHVLWVQPHDDHETSLRVLRERNKRDRSSDYAPEGHDMLAEWLLDDQARSLATHVHSTHDFSVLESAHTVYQALLATRFTDSKESAQ